jgi:hypothetical protein
MPVKLEVLAEKLANAFSAVRLHSFLRELFNETHASGCCFAVDRRGSRFIVVALYKLLPRLEGTVNQSWSSRKNSSMR